MAQNMFDEEIFSQINLEQTFHGLTDSSNKFQIRPLSINDYNNGFLEMLSQLTKVGDISEEQFQKQFNNMKKSKNYFIIVIEDINKKTIVGTGTLFMEYKFIHNAGMRGRVEDVVVSDGYRGQRLGYFLIDTIKKLAQHFKCYKLTLDCNDERISFYERLGFKAIPGRANSMTIYYT